MNTRSSNMKMPKELYERLEAAIAPLNTEHNRQMYREGKFPRAELVKDLDKRYRWDLFWASQRNDRVYYYVDVDGRSLNDTHIDTALRRIVAPL
jgi:hypothetical protein